MEEKRNEATINRPEGDRVIDAPYVFTDLDETIRLLKEEEAWQKNDRNAITIFKTDFITSVLVCLHEKAEIRNNSIDGIFTLQLLEGKLSVTTPDGDIEMKANQRIAFHHKVDHSIVATDDAVLLITINKD